MRSIFKYQIDVPPRDSKVYITEVKMYSGARILSVGTQNGWPYLWAEVFFGGPKATRLIRVVGTGFDLDAIDGPLGTFLGTVQYEGLVFHIFDCGEAGA